MRTKTLARTQKRARLIKIDTPMDKKKLFLKKYIEVYRPLLKLEANDHKKRTLFAVNNLDAAA